MHPLIGIESLEIGSPEAAIGRARRHQQRMVDVTHLQSGTRGCCSGSNWLGARLRLRRVAGTAGNSERADDRGKIGELVCKRGSTIPTFGDAAPGSHCYPQQSAGARDRRFACGADTAIERLGCSGIAVHDLWPSPWCVSRNFGTSNPSWMRHSELKRPTRSSIATVRRRACECRYLSRAVQITLQSSGSLLPGPPTKQRDCECKI